MIIAVLSLAGDFPSRRISRSTSSEYLETLACGTGSCEVVQASKWSKLFPACRSRFGAPVFIWRCLRCRSWERSSATPNRGRSRIALVSDERLRRALFVLAHICRDRPPACDLPLLRWERRDCRGALRAQCRGSYARFGCFERSDASASLSRGRISSGTGSITRFAGSRSCPKTTSTRVTMVLANGSGTPMARM